MISTMTTTPDKQSTTPDIDRLYVDTIAAMADNRDRVRFRDLVYHMMREKREYGEYRGNEHYDALWTEAVIEAVRDSKTWISAKEREEILAKIEAGNDEYEEAIASQEAAATIPSR